MNNYQKQKAKKQKAAFVEQVETGPSNPGEDSGKTGKGVLLVEAKKVNIMEDPKFLKEWAQYERDMQSIPAMLADILKETTATRLIMEAYGTAQSR